MTTEGEVPAAPTIAELKARVLKPADAWWVVFVGDPIAIRLVWLLLRVWPWVTPNAITGASLAAGLLAALAFASGWYVTGAIAFQLSFVLDCADGKLARWHRAASPRGEYWDGVVNNLVYGAAVIGLAWQGISDWRVVASAFALLLMWALHMHTAHYLPETSGGGHPLVGLERSSWFRRHRLLPPLTFFDKIALLFFVAPVAGVVLETMAALALFDSLTWLMKARIAWRATGSRNPSIESLRSEARTEA
jgi:phosphatidylglycerophosphate synthase